jgi:hypothetical protein
VKKLLLLCLVAAGCVKGTPGADDDSTGDGGTFDTSGGHYTVPGCGYDIVTVAGAEAPHDGGTTIGTNPDPVRVHLGFGGDPTTSIAILWSTDEATDVSAVKYGEGAALDQTASGATFRYIAGIGGVGDTVRMHEAHLCGLTPDTQYSYQVGAEGHYSATYTFRTAPDIGADPSAEVRIAIVGDSRTGYDKWAQVASEIQAKGVDMVMFSGDAVTLGQVQDEWDMFFDAAGDLAANTAMVSAMGNHDLDSVNYYSEFAMPGDEENYSYDYGHAHMTVLNDSPLDLADLTGSTATYLDQDLTATTQTWKILNHHRPFWSSGTSHGGDSTLRGDWGPTVDAHHVDLVVNGHDHIYERSKPMNGETPVVDPANGTIYVVSGGAGANLYGVDAGNFWTEVAESTYSYGILTIGPTMLTLEEFRPGESTPFDTFTLTK